MLFEGEILIDGLPEVVISGERDNVIRELGHYLSQYQDDFRNTLTIYVKAGDTDE